MSAPTDQTIAPVGGARFYQEFLVERDEILRYKWLESEKAGRDIGFAKALVDWSHSYRSMWRAHRHQIPVI